MRVYVAGLISRNRKGEWANIIEAMTNIRRGIRASVDILLKGHVPFCPFLDYQFLLTLQEGETIPVDRYHAYSLEWLKVCEGALFLDGWESGRGTIEEHRVAKAMGIPIWYYLSDIPDLRGPEERPFGHAVSAMLKAASKEGF